MHFTQRGRGEDYYHLLIKYCLEQRHPTGLADWFGLLALWGDFLWKQFHSN